jgi:hypothetical protein
MKKKTVLASGIRDTKSLVFRQLTSNGWFLIIYLEKSLQVLFRSPIVICLLLLHFGYHMASFDMILPNPEILEVDLSSITEFTQSS